MVISRIAGIADYKKRRSYVNTAFADFSDFADLKKEYHTLIFKDSLRARRYFISVLLIRERKL